MSRLSQKLNDCERARSRQAAKTTAEAYGVDKVAVAAQVTAPRTAAMA